MTHPPVCARCQGRMFYQCAMDGFDYVACGLCIHCGHRHVLAVIDVRGHIHIRRRRELAPAETERGAA